MNAVIYARYSSDNQREESIEGQIRECIKIKNSKINNHIMKILCFQAHFIRVIKFKTPKKETIHSDGFFFDFSLRLKQHFECTAEGC